MDKYYKAAKDTFWGLFWVGVVVLPLAYVILEKRNGELESTH